MTIVDKIINSIQAELGADFPVYYHDDATLNLMTREMEFPCALVMLLTQGRPIREGLQIKERVTAAVFFVEKSQFDFDAVQNEAIIDRCKKRAFQWLGALGADPWLTLAAENSSSRTYNRYDDILTGYGVNVDLVEVEGFTGCPAVGGDFNNDFNNDFLIAV